MSSLPEEKLLGLVERWTMVQQEMNATSNPKDIARLSKEFAGLDPVVATINTLREAEEELAGLREMLSDGSEDQEMASLAREEIAELEAEGAARQAEAG